jgi:beta-glucosidase
VERLELKAGESRRVSFALVPSRDFTRYDVARKAYVVDSGSYEVQLGASSTDIRLKSAVEVTAP